MRAGQHRNMKSIPDPQTGAETNPLIFAMQDFERRAKGTAFELFGTSQSGRAAMVVAARRQSAKKKKRDLLRNAFMATGAQQSANLRGKRLTEAVQQSMASDFKSLTEHIMGGGAGLKDEGMTEFMEWLRMNIENPNERKEIMAKVMAAKGIEVKCSDLMNYIKKLIILALL